MSEFYDPEFIANLNAAIRAFRANNPKIEVSITEHHSSNYMHIQMANLKKCSFAAIDIKPHMVPQTSEYASEFWEIIFRDLYSALLKLEST